MLTISEAIKKGLSEYEDDYIMAVDELWRHNDTIAGRSVVDWFVSQVVQESRFSEKAVSRTGARGLAQFMPKTGDEVSRELMARGALESKFDRENPKQSIKAQVYYMNKMFNVWTLNRSDESRMQLALASYNAGAGNILKAQKESLGAKHWHDISKKLKQVTGVANSKETINYVRAITEVALVINDYRE